MTPLRKRMIDDMVAAGLMANTQAAYIQAVRGLAKHTRRSPDSLSESDVRGYLLHLRDERGVAQGTFRPYHAGIQFLYSRTLDRDWALFSKKRSRHRSASVCPAFSPMPRLAPSLVACGSLSPGSRFC
jgi:integrase/recombinase XerD